MICADCGADTRVLDSRPLNDGQVCRRRRVCLACGARTTTYEIQAETFAILEAVFATVHASIGTVKARMPAQRKDSTRRKNRERVARDLEAKGAGITQIAGQMGLHPDTVRRYLSGSVRIEAA